MIARAGIFDETAAPGQPVRLRASRCDRCGRTDFPGMAVCPACGEPASDVDLPDDATLVGFSAVLYPPPGARVEAPYWVGVARFGDDLCILGLMERPAPELSIGMAIRTVAYLAADDLLTYAYRVN